MMSDICKVSDGIRVVVNMSWEYFDTLLWGRFVWIWRNIPPNRVQFFCTQEKYNF
jgi:hypothetical protein